MGLPHPRLSLISLLLLISLLIPLTSAYANEFTPVFPSTDIVHYNTTYELNKSSTTPSDIWAAAIVIGLILFLLSLLSLPNGTEDIVSVMTWVPVGFAAWSSYAVDFITSAGVTSQNGTYVLMEHHSVQAFPVIGILLIVFLVIAVGNTYRIVSLHRKMNKQQEEDYLLRSNQQ